MIPTTCQSCGALKSTDGVCPKCDAEADTERAPAMCVDCGDFMSSEDGAECSRCTGPEFFTPPSLLRDDSRALLYAMPLAFALGGVS